jgi:hypothetical protein
MNRLLYTVSPAHDGWQLCEHGERRNWFPDKRTALLAADQLAHLRHEGTGRPTGVKVQMSLDGDWVMIGSRG